MSITQTFAKVFANYDSQNSIGSKLRAKRVAPLLAMIESAFKQHGCVNIIDIGGTQAYWGIVPLAYLEAHKVNITIVNLPGMNRPNDHGPFHFKDGNGCSLVDFADKSFHVAHSNSVVEHVGDWDRMVAFSQEVKRVSSKYFVQTPNFWFPVEPHCMTPFFAWLPKPLRIWLVMHFQLGHWAKASTVDEAVRTVESARLLNHKMFCALFPDAEVKTERFLGLPKSFIAVRS
jgi:hypothetical protein